ncbi:MAG: insulinase family protein [Gammaproteobacteria bacterium]|nr:insulinase family protein [Gammaproteobacteria bacterium]
MKFRIITGVFLCLSVLLPLFAGTFEKVYDNGLKLIVLQDHRSPVVVSQLWYHVGSSYEHEGITGVSHALEHLMFKRTENAAAGEFSRLVAENGGSDNAFTGKHYTVYFQRIASNRLELCLRFEADRMNGLIFEADEFKREMDVIREERSLRVDNNPLSRFYERFIATVYTRSPLRHPVIGWPEDIQQLELHEAKEWYQRWYLPNNATLVIVGDVQFDEVDQIVTKYFSRIASRPLQPEKIRPEPPQNGLKVIQSYGQTSTPYLLMAFRAPSITQLDDPTDAYALEVLDGILDGGASARFSRFLQREQQIAVTISAGYDAFERLQGLFTITAIPNSGISLEALKIAIMEQIDRLKDEPVSDQELERVKAQVISSQVYKRDSAFYMAMQIGMLESADLDRQLLNNYVTKIDSIDAKDIQRVARRYFIETELTLGQFWPEHKRP